MSHKGIRCLVEGLLAICSPTASCLISTWLTHLSRQRWIDNEIQVILVRSFGESNAV